MSNASEIDLHIHSNVSDGSMRPREIAEHAKKLGLSAFALTDHDCTYGNEEAWQAAEELGLGFLPGLELTSQFRGRRIHVVCLGFDETDEDFRKLYRWIRAQKEALIPEIVEWIRGKGVDIDLERVVPYAFGRPLDRYAVMRYLVTLNLCEGGSQPLWDNYLNPAVRELGLTARADIEKAIPIIHKAGGVTSLAHFHKSIGLKGLDRQEQEKAILELHEMGLDGMELQYSSYSKEDGAFATRMIEKHRLLATAGTDFHGTNRPEVGLGTGIKGSVSAPLTMFMEVAERVVRRLMPQSRK